MNWTNRDDYEQLQIRRWNQLYPQERHAAMADVSQIQPRNTIQNTIVFKSEHSDFDAYKAACKWCRDKGYSHGSMCGGDPIGLIFGDVIIAKWKNLTDAERAELDGTITGDMRHGPVTITIYERGT